MNPQHYSAVSDRLFAAGARDVWLTPVQMKKGRPAVVLSVLAAARHEQAIVDIMLRETTTLGVRVTTVRRHEVQRELCNRQRLVCDAQCSKRNVQHATLGPVGATRAPTVADGIPYGKQRS